MLNVDVPVSQYVFLLVGIGALYESSPLALRRRTGTV
jgi:hypothetical protein